MFNWKMIATIFILLIGMLLILSTSPTVSQFFVSIQDRFFNMFGYVGEDTIPRNVSFALTVDSYDNISFNTGRPVNISLEGNFMADISNGNVNSDTAVIINFKGSGEIKKHEISLNGRFDGLEIANSSVSLEAGLIESNSTFSKLTIDNFALSSLNTESATGSLIIGDVETRVSQQLIVVSNPLGRFEFNDGLKVEGFANIITIPSIGMSMGG